MLLCSSKQQAQKSRDKSKSHAVNSNRAASRAAEEEDKTDSTCHPRHCSHTLRVVGTKQMASNSRSCFSEPAATWAELQPCSRALILPQAQAESRPYPSSTSDTTHDDPWRVGTQLYLASLYLRLLISRFFLLIRTPSRWRCSSVVIVPSSLGLIPRIT